MASVTVTFGTGTATNPTSIWIDAAGYTENGVTVLPVYDGSSFGAPHFSILTSTHGATAADNSAYIHEGNSAEEVEITFSGGIFNLDSTDIESFELPSGSVTFTASSGATFSTDHVGTIDFDTLAGWTGLTSFTIALPLGDYACVLGVSCRVLRSIIS